MKSIIQSTIQTIIKSSYFEVFVFISEKMLKSQAIFDARCKYVVCFHLTLTDKSSKYISV